MILLLKNGIPDEARERLIGRLTTRGLRIVEKRIGDAVLLELPDAHTLAPDLLGAREIERVLSSPPGPADRFGFLPDPAMRLGVTLLVGLALLVLLAGFWPSGISSPVDSLDTPGVGSPSWILAAAHQVWKVVPSGVRPFVFGALFLLFAGFLLSIPFAEKGPRRSWRHRPWAWAGLVLFSTAAVLTLVGVLS